jgi:hypothetical protein
MSIKTETVKVYTTTDGERHTKLEIAEYEQARIDVAKILQESEVSFNWKTEVKDLSPEEMSVLIKIGTALFDYHQI